jgi:molybdate/tungstate transport system permease protein
LPSKLSTFHLAFAAAGGLLVAFVLLPLITAVFGTTPGSLLLTFSDPQVIRSTVTTFLAASLATGIAIPLGLPLAYLLARRRLPAGGVIETIVNLPIVIPHTSAGIALLMVFGSKGALGRLFAPLGVYFTDTLWGVMVAMLFVSLPYLVNTCQEAFHLIDEDLEKTALVEGASYWQAFLLVTLPIARRGVLAGVMLMWARGISEFGAVVILAYHPRILPVLVFERFEGFGLSAAQPIAVFLIITVFVLFTILRWALLRKRD